ncbi:ABC transporter permease [Idiomarina sp.]|uniref:ABC transporter permease n=3 Tax=unclassified Idiomarina TaxID=2614829 RepID=UPI000C9684BE|nr:ABC transporter permease [Idiomarina sp.]MAD53502.1 sodium ABC transporter permease [Idiomarinaceae bacterium]MEC7643829.1 ABC transporter permease [Pseudomonadota bacterium]NQZ03188.1 ABC transporter permease [Idiomarina sp.]|tara:strand:- start:6021 stop:7217 length:1197 start_codon:yes stop_codon:yes gene_type:complete
MSLLSSKVSKIAWWEFRRFFKWKQELISIGLLVVIMAVSMGWGAISAVFEEQYNGAIYFEQRANPGDYEAPKDITLRDAGSMEIEKWKSQLPEALDVVVIVHPDNTATLRVHKRDDWQSDLTDSLQSYLQTLRVAGLELTDEQRTVLDSKPEVTLDIAKVDVDESAVDDEGSSELGMFLGIGISVGVFTGFGLMMMSITAEKQQRVTEQLLTIISPREWMDGKIVGITLHSLKAMVFIGLFFGAIALLAASFSSEGSVSFTFDPFVVIASFVFVMLGLLMINAMLAGFSATIDDPNHSSRSSFMLIPLLPIFLCFSVVDSPDGTLAQIMSILPVSSFMMMPARLAQTDVAWWQIGLSLALLVVSLIWMRNVAARLFAMGIQFYGKEPSWKDIWNAIRG